MSPRLPLVSPSAPAPARTFGPTSPARTLLAAVALLGGLFASGPAALGQEVATVPVGAVNIQILAGTGTSRVVSVISLPLTETTPLSHQTRYVSALSANSISSADAEWTPGAFSTSQAPYLIEFTSGNLIGQKLLISTAGGSQSTSDTLFIDAEEANIINLQTSGLNTGDTFRLIPCDTISSVFGTPEETEIQGGGTSASADIIQMLVLGGWRQYYYNTTSNTWLRVGPNTNSNNVAIRPDTAILYNRIANSPISLTLIGNVPEIDRKALVRNSGVTTLAHSIPVDTTLNGLNLQNTPSWVTSSNSSTADIVQILVSGAWRQYFHNGTQWIRVGPNTPSNNQVIPAGSGIIITKRGSESGASIYSQPLPYTL